MTKGVYIGEWNLVVPSDLLYMKNGEDLYRGKYAPSLFVISDLLLQKAKKNRKFPK